MSTVATLIVARNAEDTLGDSILSALSEPIDELLIVDDLSEDGTVEVAESFEDSRVRIIRLAEHSTLGYARGVGLNALNSDFCFLLDADDSFLPGRVNRLMGVLNSGEIDFVADEIELVDGVSGAFIRRITVPAFLDKPPGLMRLFERNYLPGIGQIAFRVEAMRAVGYDPNIHGTEDSDLVLRSLMAGVRGGVVRKVGYRMRHFRGSVSRNRARQSSELSGVMLKFPRNIVRPALLKAGASELVVGWCLLSLAFFQRNFLVARSELEKIESMDRDWNSVLEPEGPCPVSERWRLEYAKGTLALVNGEEAMHHLEAAVKIARWPEALNNLGVACFRSGELARAIDYFDAALAQLDGYADARENLETAGRSEQVTLHALRREPSRSEY